MCFTNNLILTREFLLPQETSEYFEKDQILKEKKTRDKCERILENTKKLRNIYSEIYFYFMPSVNPFIIIFTSSI